MILNIPRASWLILVVLALVGRNAAAQDAPDPPRAPQSSTPIVAGWQDGFVLRSPDDAYRLIIGAAMQVDGRFSLDDPPSITNTFLLRKIRPTFNGRVAKYFTFRLTPDFANGTALVQDAYFEIQFSDKFRVRTGKDKTPVGYESLLGDAYLLFPEKSLASALLPSRDVGIATYGVLANGRVSYGAGLFNGIPDGTTSAPADSDTNNGKDLAGRIVFQPFKRTSGTTPLSGLGIETGGTFGHEHGVLPTFRTSVGQTYFAYDAAAIADGTRVRASTAAFYYYRSLGAFGEFTRSRQTVSRSRAATNVANHAWEATASFVLTGEPASDRGVRPSRNFDPPMHHWGALQVIARCSSLTIDDAAFAGGLASTNASGGARAISAGVNWYLTPNVRYYATFEETVFSDSVGVHRPNEHTVIIRAQLAF